MDLNNFLILFLKGNTCINNLCKTNGPTASPTKQQWQACVDYKEIKEGNFFPPYN